MIDYVNAGDPASTASNDDRVGVIVFGRDAAIEIPPFDDDVQIARGDREPARSRVHEPGRGDEAGPGLVSRGRRQADRRRQRRQPEPRRRRRAGPGAGRRGRGHRRGAGPLSSPRRGHRRARGAARRHPPRPAVRPRVVVTNTSEPTAGRLGRGPRPAGRRAVGRRPDGRAQRRDGDACRRASRSSRVRQEIDAPSFYTYEARFVPDRPDDDPCRRTTARRPSPTSTAKARCC